MPARALRPAPDACPATIALAERAGACWRLCQMFAGRQKPPAASNFLARMAFGRAEATVQMRTTPSSPRRKRAALAPVASRVASCPSVWSIKPPPPRGAPEWRAALRFGRRGGGWPRVPLGRSGTRSSAAVRRRREHSLFTLVDPLRPDRKMTALARLVRRPKCVGGRGSASQRHMSVGGVARVVEAPRIFSQ